MKEKKGNLFGKLLSTKMVAVISVLMLAISCFSFSVEAKAENKFKDVGTNHWASKEIDFLTGKQIIFGYKDGTFKPNNSITRLQAVMMILREKDIKDASESIIDPGFADIKPGQTGYADVAKAVELGIIDGMVNEKGQRVFNPQGTLTRAQMAKILALGYNLTGTSDTNFTDVPKTHWSYTYIQALAKNGITAGYSNGRFGAGESLTRAQFASMMARLLDKSFVVTPPVVKPTEPKPSEPSKPSQPSKPSKPVITPDGGVSTYPDGWVPPFLRSKWSPNHATNLKTLQNELGFKDGGHSYSVTGFSKAIVIVDEPSTSPYELKIVFNVWQDSDIPDTFKIPMAGSALFKLYFENDGDKVWNSFASGEVPEHFTANGRKVDSTTDSETGVIVLKVGKK